MDKIRLLIMEDDIGWLESLKLFLSRFDDFTIAAAVSNRKDAVKLATVIDFDIALLDISLNDQKYDGIYAAAEISQLNDKVKVIMLTCLEEDKAIVDSFAAGAINYVYKNNYSDLPDVIRSVYNKNSPIEILAKKFSKLHEEMQLSVLTPAEKEIFNLVEMGYTQSQIADKLYKTKGTLRIQINKMIKKLGTKSIKDAVKLVKMGGFFENKR